MKNTCLFWDKPNLTWKMFNGLMLAHPDDWRWTEKICKVMSVQMHRVSDPRETWWSNAGTNKSKENGRFDMTLPIKNGGHPMENIWKYGNLSKTYLDVSTTTWGCKNKTTVLEMSYVSFSCSAKVPMFTSSVLKIITDRRDALAAVHLDACSSMNDTHWFLRRLYRNKWFQINDSWYTYIF